MQITRGKKFWRSMQARNAIKLASYIMVSGDNNSNRLTRHFIYLSSTSRNWKLSLADSHNISIQSCSSSSSPCPPTQFVRSISATHQTYEKRKRSRCSHICRTWSSTSIYKANRKKNWRIISSSIHVLVSHYVIWFGEKMIVWLKVKIFWKVKWRRHWTLAMGSVLLIKVGIS